MLSVQNLDVVCCNAHLVQDVSLKLAKGKCLCLLGPSGSGKSLVAKSIMGLLDTDLHLNIRAILNGKPLSKAKLGRDLSMIFQDPLLAFNNYYKIGTQIEETIAAISKLSRPKIKHLARDIVHQLDAPVEILKQFPSEISPSLLQQLMVKLAVMMEPRILVADDPTSSVNSVIRDEIVEELIRLKNKNTSIILITHDLIVAKALADEILVMDKGKVINSGSYEDLVAAPCLDYTALLKHQSDLLVCNDINILAKFSRETA